MTLFCSCFAGCGFVQFAKWAQAEMAMEAHNGKTRLGSSEVPLVVKFADAKRRDSQQQGGPGMQMPFKGAAKWLETAGHLGDHSHGGDFPYQVLCQTCRLVCYRWGRRRGMRILHGKKASCIWLGSDGSHVPSAGQGG